jgi:hypothetical protein
MATKLSAAGYVEAGYGQVEPNHLSAQRTGQIYAQLPVAATIKVLENGQFVKYNYADGAVNFEADGGEWMLVYNEVKVYDERHQQDCDFAMLAENYGGYIAHAGIAANTRDLEPAVLGMVPRVFKTNVGDIFTTNTIKAEPESLAVGDELVIGDDGYLTKTAGEKAGTMKWQVVKVYTMPDGQPGVKIVRIA